MRLRMQAVEHFNELLKSLMVHVSARREADHYHHRSITDKCLIVTFLLKFINNCRMKWCHSEVECFVADVNFQMNLP